jgi:hypothetical protein
MNQKEKNERIEALGKCVCCDFQRAGDYCIEYKIHLDEKTKKDGCINFQWERS